MASKCLFKQHSQPTEKREKCSVCVCVRDKVYLFTRSAKHSTVQLVKGERLTCT